MIAGRWIDVVVLGTVTACDGARSGLRMLTGALGPRVRCPVALYGRVH
ncbi:hypothetical protein SAMN04489712_10488 [Thermomonospora echinospora]|uniref:Uncharacterized protein n=1 Tax=Thermomonospora echinospora TaxID=1992 RepID=A0A1H5YNJ6_9ACTN|nr:hypothetical protein SAMN04489712_10488 [Thermomonospora echinospora]